MNKTELNRRQPVWLAISEFYLDTDLSKEQIYLILTEFKKSGYTLTQLKDIDFYEVKPIVGSNLNSVAGIWSGFDEAWLLEKIERERIGSWKKGFITRFRRRLFDKARFSYWKRFQDDFSVLPN